MKQVYYKGSAHEVATSQAEADALVADGYTPGEQIAELPAEGVDKVTEAEFTARERTGAGTTALRPAPAVKGAGFSYFDTTLGKPIWVDAAATGWVDATGTPVV